MYLLFHIGEKSETNKHLEEPHLFAHKIPGSMVAVCLVQRLLNELKHSDLLNLI